MSLETAKIVSFVLAICAYASLGADAATRAFGRPRVALTRTTAALASLHALLMWHYVYGWSYDAAVARGTAPFTLFHVVWFLVVSVCFLPRETVERIVPSAFAILSIAALPAPFRYPGMEAYRIPVCVVFGVCLLAIGTGRSRRPT